MPFRFTSISHRHSSSSISQRFFLPETSASPALFTRISTRPNSLTARSTISRTWSGCVTSTSSASAWRPVATISSATEATPRHPASCSCVGIAFGGRGAAVTRASAPSCANRNAIARPMPRIRPAPVTMATLPASGAVTVLLQRPSPERHRGACVQPCSIGSNSDRLQAP